MTDLDPVATFADVLRREGSMTEAEIENLLSKIGRVVAGSSEAKGEGRAVRAAQAAIKQLPSDGSIKQARGISVEIASGDDLTESEVNAAAEAIHQACGSDTEILIGHHSDERLEGAARVTVVTIGTGVRT